MNPAELLDRIEKHIKPLNPPVVAFEQSAAGDPFRVLLAVMLSSRTRDPVTRKAVEQLFSLAKDPDSMLALTEKQIEAAIFPVGFYKQKARRIRDICAMIIAKGTILPEREFLESLPGVGRKTAGLVLSLAFHVPAIAVDIHVFRISRRLGWSDGETPEAVEKDLMRMVPKNQWRRVNQVLVGFGQTVCAPRNPLCNQCAVSGECRYFREQNLQGPCVRQVR